MIALQCCLNFCCCLVGKSCLTLGDLTDCSLPGLGFPRQEYWSGLPFPSPGDPPDPGIEPMSPVSPALWADSLPLSHLGTHIVDN